MFNIENILEFYFLCKRKFLENFVTVVKFLTDFFNLIYLKIDCILNPFFFFYKIYLFFFEFIYLFIFLFFIFFILNLSDDLIFLFFRFLFFIIFLLIILIYKLIFEQIIIRRKEYIIKKIKSNNYLRLLGLFLLK